MGDTSADVEAGHESRVRVIAVASGRSNEEEPRAAGAESILPDLRDTDLLVRLDPGQPGSALPRVG
ncbi:HAD family hydrolase [Streptomyces gobiensis]|uniref:HAD family hydrolase n=1 Tax=Streptomyces gobiensis TaxID=2875706 RepID=UPI001E2DA5A2|nr:HAD hydrolase-like protein [Streptomyces gobiensis]